MTASTTPLISIVDDEALARDGTRELVESFGYRAITFESAQHFLASSALAETTCMITDVQMPGLSGLELQEVLRSQGNYMPIIVITAYPNEKHRTRALENGRIGFWVKPFPEKPLMDGFTADINCRSAQAPFQEIAPCQLVDALPAAIYVTDSKGYIRISTTRLPRFGADGRRFTAINGVGLGDFIGWTAR